MNVAPAELAARHAVGVALHGATRVLVASSGGPDSVALAGATAWVAQHEGITAGAAIIDHQLQPSSADMTRTAEQGCLALGLDPVLVRVVDVGSEGGLEAAARTARYTALAEAADTFGADAVLLGHTRDDQAETVLLRLLRGSGARSLAAMRPVQGIWRRPFLDVARRDVHQVADAIAARHGIAIVRDPHNTDPAFARVRVRALLEPWSDRDVAVAGLARSAELLGDDADYLDACAQEEMHRLVRASSAEASTLAALPRALRTRVLRLMALDAGVPSGVLTHDHIAAIEALVTQWHGQGEIALPCGVRAWREYGRLRIQ